MIDKKKLLEIIKSRKISFSKPIMIYTISSIMSEYNDKVKNCLDFYLEELRSSAGEWEWNCYLDYYDENADAIILIKDVGRALNRYYEIPDEKTLVEQICLREEIVNHYREKFLVFKKDKNV